MKFLIPTVDFAPHPTPVSPLYVGYDGRWPKGFNEFLASTFDNVRDQVYSVARNYLPDIRISSGHGWR
jgi:hypothetical protein